MKLVELFFCSYRLRSYIMQGVWNMRNWSAKILHLKTRKRLKPSTRKHVSFDNFTSYISFIPKYISISPPPSYSNIFHVLRPRTYVDPSFRAVNTPNTSEYKHGHSSIQDGGSLPSYNHWTCPWTSHSRTVFAGWKEKVPSRWPLLCGAHSGNDEPVGCEERSVTRDNRDVIPQNPDIEAGWDRGLPVEWGWRWGQGYRSLWCCH